MFQIESPGQRELVGKFGPQTFEDIIIDISLFRPGPVKSDMVTPFLMARNGWRDAVYPHPDLEFALAETAGVVVFHEQVLQVVARMTGCTLAEADEVRRALGEKDAHPEVRAWFVPRALAAGYPVEVAEQVWTVLAAFGSFGFCKAHAAAFALPTYQSAWLKTHHPAAFLAGVLTHDPGMYPKRLILDDARNFGIRVLGLDVNASADTYRVERIEPDARRLRWRSRVARAGGGRSGCRPRCAARPDYGIRLALADVKGISDDEVARIVDRPALPLADRLLAPGVGVPAGGRAAGAGRRASTPSTASGCATARPAGPTHRRKQVTRRDLLLQIGELDRWSRSGARASSSGQLSLDLMGLELPEDESRRRAAPEETGPSWAEGSGLPEFTDAELVRAELEVLGLDASRHVIDFYRPFLAALGAVPAGELLSCRSGAEVLVAGVKVATQTPPIRSGRRVVFVTLDDGTGCTDSTFFEDAQGPYAATVFHSWLLVIRGCCGAPVRAGCRCGPPGRGSCRRCTRRGRPTGSTACAS